MGIDIGLWWTFWYPIFRFSLLLLCFETITIRVQQLESLFCVAREWRGVALGSSLEVSDVAKKNMVVRWVISLFRCLLSYPQGKENGGVFPWHDPYRWHKLEIAFHWVGNSEKTKQRLRCAGQNSRTLMCEFCRLWRTGIKSSRLKQILSGMWIPRFDSMLCLSK